MSVRTTVVAFLVGAAILGGCTESGGSGGDSSGRYAPAPTLAVSFDPTIVDTPQGAVAEVYLDFNRDEAREGPRMVELYLRHAAGLEFVEARRGEAAERANKQLYAQPQADGRLRVMIFSAGNLDRLDSGRLATLRFRVVNPADTAVAIVDEGPVFAPPEAAGGVVLGDPVRLPAEEGDDE